MTKVAPFLALAGAIAGLVLRPHSEVPALAGGGFAAALAIAIPYGRRFRATAPEYVSLVAHLALLLLLPLVPLAFWRAPVAATWVYQVFMAWTAAWVLLSQGRYLGTDREVPELSGPAREIADRALADAGLRPLRVLVARFPNLNALVVGLKTCVVVVDRRASESLSPGQFRAMLAHEAAHVRQNAMFWHALTWTLGATLLNVASGMRLGGAMAVLGVAGVVFCGGGAIKQSLELDADRFALRFAPVGDVASMLRRVVADLPTSALLAAHSLLMMPFASHPPLEARLGAIGAGPAGLLWMNRGVRAGALVATVVMPWAVTLLRWPHARALAMVTAAVLMTWLIAAYVWRWISATGSYAITMGVGGGSAGWLIGGVVALALAIVAIVARETMIRDTRLLMGGLAAAIAGLWMLGRSRRGRITSLSRTERAAIVEAVSAFSEGKPAEALELATKGLSSRPKQPWLLAVRGASLAQTGDPALAVAELESIDRRFTFGLFQLVVAEILADRLDDARANAAALTKLAPRDPLAWDVRGLAEFAAGDVGAADASFIEECRLRPASARGLAWRALANVERAGTWTPEASRFLEESRAIEPDAPPAHLAEARRAGLAGEAGAARASYDRAMEALRREGLAGWGRWYATLARRWGILEPVPPA